MLTALVAAMAVSHPLSARAQTAQPQSAQGQTVPSSSAQIQWDGVERVIAFADVHGAFTELETLLRESGIVDAQDHWAAGRTHVVSLGDLLDRGTESRKVLDLLMRLQGEALAAGGQLHVVLGNHEAMNLLGDLRYVDPAEYASYADLDPPGTRSDGPFPPGYFGRRAAFAPQGRYGQWLLALPVAIRINDTLFMHGGPAGNLQGVSLQALNLRYRTALTDYLGLEAQLEQAKLLQAGDEYAARPQLARDRLRASIAAHTVASDSALIDAVQRFVAATTNVLISESGPNWYRGAALCNEASEADVLLPLLQQYGVARLVVGHTTTRDGRAATRFDGRVIKLDAGMNRAAYKGRGAALIIASSGLNVRYAGELGATPLQPESLFVAPNQYEDASVLAALRDGDVSVPDSRGPDEPPDELQVTVSSGGRRIAAVFLVRDPRAADREVAAYRLDRLMGLGIVPVTVAREVQGRRGVLQARPSRWLTQAAVDRQNLRGSGWCGIEPQLQLISAFDGLTGNEGRVPESIVMDTANWYAYASRFERAFGSTIALRAYLKARPKLGAEIRRRMAALDEAKLEQTLGDLLDARARKAIVARRDVLLALVPEATAKTP